MLLYTYYKTDEFSALRDRKYMYFYREEIKLNLINFILTFILKNFILVS